MFENKIYFSEILRDANRQRAVEIIGRMTPNNIEGLADMIAGSISLEKFPEVMSILEDAFTNDADNGDGVPCRLRCVYDRLMKSRSENGRKFADIMYKRFEEKYFHGRRKKGSINPSIQ
jgi:hypothetical protein